uniref:hypothetical protein n=1 Tax=Methylocystis sp. TaxID=1911079 RepID=UPI0025E0228D
MSRPQTTRRAVMAGLAAARVAGLPAIAGVAAADDPIFAAFAEFERAKAANNTVTEAVDELRGETREVIEAAGLYQPAVSLTHLGFPNRQMSDSYWRTEGGSSWRQRCDCVKISMP